jgi:hypothetical protein
MVLRNSLGCWNNVSEMMEYWNAGIMGENKFSVNPFY